MITVLQSDKGLGRPREGVSGRLINAVYPKTPNDVSATYNVAKAPSLGGSRARPVLVARTSAETKRCTLHAKGVN